MKLKTNLIFLSFTLIALLFSACSNSPETKAIKSVETFISAWNNKDLGEMYTVYLSSTDIDELIDSLGAIDDYSLYKSDVDDAVENFIEVKLYYRCKLKNISDSLYFMFNIHNESKYFFIGSFEYNQSRDFIDNYDQNYINASAVCDVYYNYISDDNLNDIISLLDDKTIPLDMNEYFIEFIKERQDNYGKPTSYSIYSHKTTTIDDEPAFIFVFQCETDGMYQTMYEEITLIKRNGNYKIYDDKYASTVHDLETIE